MKKFLTVSTAVAALMLGVSGASALDEPKSMYITGEGENRMVMGGDNTEGARLLAGGEGGAAPTECPAGAYYEVNNQVRPCEGEGSFTLQEPGEGVMMSNGEAYPEGTMLLQSEQGPDDTTGTDANDGTEGAAASSGN
jgi:hypothetical protein